MIGLYANILCWLESASALAQVYYDSQSDVYHTISPIQDINEIPAQICSTKSPVLINIFPNSGASICLAGSHHLQELNLKQEDLICCHRKVKAVGGSKLICHGRLPMNFTIDKHATTQKVYFCDKADCFYFSKKGCLDKHKLPSQFPYPKNINNSPHTSPALVAATTSTSWHHYPINIHNPSTVTTTTIKTTTPGNCWKYPQTREIPSWSVLWHNI